MRNPISDKSAALKPSGIRKFFDVVSEMPDAISLGVGEPDFDTPWFIRDEGIYALEKGRTFYTSNAGLKELRQEIAAYLNRRCGLTYDPLHEVVVTVGGSEAIDIGLRAMLDPGDEVLIPEPCYVSYLPCVQLADGVPVPIRLLEEHEFRLTAGQLEAAITPKTKVLIMPFPNNPTGAVASRNELLKWVEYARANRAIILYDSAYEAFIQDSSIPRSIFEIPGARDCAIEFRSFSKQGGFTGVRCGYVVIPKELHGYDSEGNKVSISRLWSRRTSTKFNGASYIVQRGAAALFTMEGMAQTAALISHYLGNASLLLNACRQAGMRVWGGENAPYVWVQCPDGLDSWQMFDKMLHEANVVITPGSGFGSRVEGFFRISAFNSRENVDEVCRRIHSLFAR